MPIPTERMKAKRRKVNPEVIASLFSRVSELDFVQMDRRKLVDFFFLFSFF